MIEFPFKQAVEPVPDFIPAQVLDQLPEDFLSSFLKLLNELEPNEEEKEILYLYSPEEWEETFTKEFLEVKFTNPSLHLSIKKNKDLVFFTITRKLEDTFFFSQTVAFPLGLLPDEERLRHFLLNLHHNPLD